MPEAMPRPPPPFSDATRASVTGSFSCTAAVRVMPATCSGVLIAPLSGAAPLQFITFTSVGFSTAPRCRSRAATTTVGPAFAAGAL